MKLPFHDPRSARLEAGLRSAAREFGPTPPPELRARILAAVQRAPRAVPVPAPVAHERAGTWLAVAAAVLVLCGAWWLARASGSAPASGPAFVRLTRGVFGAGRGVLALPQEAEDSLRSEAERLLADTTRAAQLVVRGLPGPLRQRLEQM